MPTNAGVSCSCGHRVEEDEVLETGQIVRFFTPSFSYVKFRCAHCRRVGERFLPAQRVRPTGPPPERVEVTEEERNRFQRLGSIDPGEVLAFRAELERCTLDDLMQGVL